MTGLLFCTACLSVKEADVHLSPYLQPETALMTDSGFSLSSAKKC